MTSENINAKQSRKVTSSDRFICNLHICLGKNEKTPWGKDEETPSSCSRFRHQRLRNSRYRLQILDTRMGLLIIIALPITCLVEKLSCTHMINRIYHHITHACMILVPKICNIHNSASLVVVCKSWTLVRIPSSLPQHGDRLIESVTCVWPRSIYLSRGWSVVTNPSRGFSRDWGVTAYHPRLR